MKLLIVASLLGCLPVAAQNEPLKPYEQKAFYDHLDEAQESIKRYSQAEPERGNDHYTENYGKPEPSIVFRKQPGHYYYKDWYAGLMVDIGVDMWHSVAAIPENGGNMKDHPSQNRQFDVTKDRIVFRFYNDMQTRPDEKTVTADNPYEYSGGAIVGGTAAVRPEDMFVNQFNCKTGSRTEDVWVWVGEKRYKCKVKATCQHKNYRLAVSLGGSGGGFINGRYHAGSVGNGAGTPKDFLSPWKFTHVVTYTFDLNALAQAMGMNRKEMAQAIIAAGGILIGTYPVLASLDAQRIDVLYRPMNAMLLSVLRDQTGLSQQQLDEIRPRAYQLAKEQQEREEQQAREKLKAEKQKYLAQAKEKWQEYFNRGVKALRDSVAIAAPYRFITDEHSGVSTETYSNLLSPVLLDSAVFYAIVMVNAATEIGDDVELQQATERLCQTYLQQYYSFYVDDEIMRHTQPNSFIRVSQRCWQFVQSRPEMFLASRVGLADIEHTAGHYEQCIKYYLEGKSMLEKYEEILKANEGFQEFRDSLYFKLSKEIVDYLDHEDDFDWLRLETPYIGINELLKLYPGQLEYLEQKGRIMLRRLTKPTVKEWVKKNILTIDPDYAQRDTPFAKELMRAKILKRK